MAALPVGLTAACKRRRTPATGPGIVEQRTRDNGRTFTAHQWDAVDAACSRLIPSDDGEPGAHEARAVNYIDAQLALPDFAGLRKMFEAGLMQMDRLCNGRSFASASTTEQDAVLRRMERGVALGRRRSSARFFRVLLTFSVEGFLCDPVYGGNHGKAGWRFIGFEPRPPRPRRPYRSSTA